MLFRITITKVEREEWSKKEHQKVADSGNTRDGGPIYEYVAAPPEARKVETTVYSQETEVADIRTVIAAVNGLKLS